MGRLLRRACEQDLEGCGRCLAAGDRGVLLEHFDSSIRFNILLAVTPVVANRSLFEVHVITEDSGTPRSRQELGEGAPSCLVGARRHRDCVDQDAGTRLKNQPSIFPAESMLIRIS
jgi:hypothetical protein